jgi:hypothetical protein
MENKMRQKFLSSIAALLVLASAINPCFAQQGAQWQTSDNASPLELNSGNGCSVALTTGAFAANPANSGGLSAPAIVRAQNQNTVLQVVTSAAASALTLTCDIIPQNFRTTPGKGISITGIQVQYGVQTSALTSVTSPNTFSTITYPSVGAAAAGTVAAISGTPVFNPVLASAQLTTTTSGQCFTQNITPASPILVNNAVQRVIFEEVFNQTVASATTYQICGVTVFYNNVVF